MVGVAFGKYQNLETRQGRIGLFDRAEIRELENALEKLASRPESSGNVLNRARQIVAVAD
jgi:hypothetical protein